VTDEVLTTVNEAELCRTMAMKRRRQQDPPFVGETMSILSRRLFCGWMSDQVFLVYGWVSLERED
jgi:hypothetical protein